MALPVYFCELCLLLSIASVDTIGTPEIYEKYMTLFEKK
jgi:hypothetical protein